jgi:GNAT superfamily N-acetyltransferase
MTSQMALSLESAHSPTTSPPSYTWEQKVDGITYKISNDTSFLDLGLFNKAFASDDVYWTGPMSEEAVKLMVANSCVLGLYILRPMRTEANHNIKLNTIAIHEQIGFGRLITDYCTLAYITDVYLKPEHQGNGLGKWMVACMKEIVDSFPALRRAVLLTQANGKGVRFYEKELGMRIADPQKDKYGFMEYVPR